MSDTEQERIMTRTGMPRIGRAASAVLSAAALVAVAVGAVELANVSHAHSSAPALGASANGIVPWTNRPAPAYAAPAVSAPVTPRALYSACTASDLAGSVSTTFGLGTGQYTRYLILKNVSRGACTLSGGPSAVAGVRQGGSRTVLAGPTGTSSDPNLIGPANLRSGQSAWLAITTESMCPGGTATCARSSYAQVIVTIRGGQVRFAFTGHQPFSLVDGGGVAVSAFGVPVPAPAPVTSPLDVLTVTITAPKTLTAGATENYQVTLRNPTQHAVALTPCPSYEEFVSPLGSDLGIQVHRYFLNCSAAPTIPAGGSVTFAMQLPVPDATGLAKYGWLLQGTSVERGGAVTVG